MDRVDYQSLIIQDLINDHRDQKLNLNPWYQRRSVWTPAQKSYLINTLFERKPIPALYVRHTIDLERERSVKEVVDGQQRSRSIIEYCENAFSARISAEGSRKHFRDLSPSERERFLITPIPIGFLLGASDKDVIDIFGRINSVSKSLNAQEKRNSKYSGEFKQFCLRVAIENLNFWREANVFTANDISRMNEVQFVADLALNMMRGLSDFRPASLDKIYESNENEFPEREKLKARMDRIFSALFELDQEVIKTTIFNRPPILFSLLLCLDEVKKIPSDLASRLYQIDAEYGDDDLEFEEVVEFRKSVSASTQRLGSRKIRRNYILARLN